MLTTFSNEITFKMWWRHPNGIFFNNLKTKYLPCFKKVVGTELERERERERERESERGKQNLFFATKMFNEINNFQEGPMEHFT